MDEINKFKLMQKMLKSKPDSSFQQMVPQIMGLSYPIKNNFLYHTLEWRDNFPYIFLNISPPPP